MNPVNNNKIQLTSDSSSVLLIYGDESCHLCKDDSPYMVIGLIACKESDKLNLTLTLRSILSEHGMDPYSEIKWTKISPCNTNTYMDVVNLFINDERLFFRAILIQKSQICNELMNQSHSEFYGKMYYQALKYLIINEFNFYDNYDEYRIFIDISDTIGKSRVKLLQDIFHGMFQRRNKPNKHIRIQEVKSNEALLLQVADIISGAIQYIFRSEYKSGKSGKSQITDMFYKTYQYNPNLKCFSNSRKFNVFFWKGGK